MRRDQLDTRVAFVRSLERKKFVAHDAQAVHIRCIRDGFTQELFGTHVPWITEQLSLLGEAGDRLGARLQDRGDSEVREHHAVRILLSYDVVRLDVPVDDSLLVGRRQRRGHLAQSLAGLLDRHDSLGLELIREVPPFDVLHDDERRPVLEGAHSMYGRDVVVVDLRGGSRLAFKSFPCGLVLGYFGVQDLDGDEPPECRLASHINPRHGALAQQSDDRELRGQLRLELGLMIRRSHGGTYSTCRRRSL